MPVSTFLKKIDRGDGGKWNLLTLTIRMSTQVVGWKYRAGYLFTKAKFGKGISYPAGTIIVDDNGHPNNEGENVAVGVWSSREPIYSESWSVITSLIPQTASAGGGSGGGGRGGVRGNKGAPARIPSKDRMSKCLQEQFRNGTQLTGLRANRSSIVLSIARGGQSFDVTTHLDRYTEVELGRLDAQNYNIPYTNQVQAGYTTGSDPTNNDIASEVTNGVEARQYSSVGFIALLFHELGNAIAGKIYADDYRQAIREGRGTKQLQDPFHLSISPTATGDRDSGVRFERCLFGGIVNLRTGRVGNTRGL